MRNVYRWKMVSDRFEGANRVERHRMVNEALSEELAGAIHALAVKAMTPAESEAQRDRFIEPKAAG